MQKIGGNNDAFSNIDPPPPLSPPPPTAVAPLPALPPLPYRSVRRVQTEEEMLEWEETSSYRAFQVLVRDPVSYHTVVGYSVAL